MKRIEVPTPCGTLVAAALGDPDYPGVYVSLKGEDGTEIDLAATEFHQKQQAVVTHVWGNAAQEQETNVVTHVGLEAPSGSAAHKTTDLTTASPVCYICAPYRGDEEWQQELNIENAKAFGRYALKRGYIPFIPHLAICGFLRDERPAERDLGMQIDAIFLKAYCDELWVFGSTISDGMREEIRIAEELGMPIRYIQPKHPIGYLKNDE